METGNRNSGINVFTTVRCCDNSEVSRKILGNFQTKDVTTCAFPYGGHSLVLVKHESITEQTPCGNCMFAPFKVRGLCPVYLNTPGKPELPFSCVDRQNEFYIFRLAFTQKTEELLEKKQMSTTVPILDSGERRVFDSGAKRDIQEGKGRNDLLHPGVMSLIMNSFGACQRAEYLASPKFDCKRHLQNWYANPVSSDLTDLVLAYMCCCAMLYGKSGMADVAPKQDSPTPLQIFVEGTAMLAKHYEKGAKKYGDHNWSKGIPSVSFYDSAHRHIDKHIMGMTDEPHIEACMFNIVGLLYNNLCRPDLEFKIYAGGKRLNEKDAQGDFEISPTTPAKPV